MKRIRDCGVTLAGGVLILMLLTAAAGSLPGEAAEMRPVGAKIIEVYGFVEAVLPGEEARTLSPGDCVAMGEQVTVHRGSAVTLALADKTVREFTGPTTLRIEENQEDLGGKVLANLTAAVADMLFQPEQTASETVMATRRVTDEADHKILVPILTHPAPGARLIAAPAAFEWIRIQGVRLYHISVYNTQDLLWQETTSAPRATCPAEDCEFRPGETYYWVVEALVGDTRLRPEAADFTILDAGGRSRLESALKATDASVSDARMATLVKARLCMDARVYDKAMDILDQYTEHEHPDRTAYMFRAEISERIGFMEDAVHYYKKALTMPSGG